MKIVREMGNSELSRSRIDALLRRLPYELRETIVMRFYEGRNHADIAQECGVRLETARKRVFCGISLLRKKLYSRGILISEKGIRALLNDQTQVPEPEALFSKVMEHIFKKKTAEFNLV